jgi:G:T-mismatch repair DNA endonuclease (very short patch repair protein)
MEFMTNNEVYFNGNKLLGREKRGSKFNQWTYVFNNNVEILGSNFKRGTIVSIKCNGTGQFYNRGYKEHWFCKKWFSQTFRSTGENNGMFGKPGPNLGKKFSNKTKQKIGFAAAQRVYSKEVNAKKGRAGTQNAFYGKTHTQESKEKMSSNRKGKCIGKDNPFYGKTHSKETIEKITLNGYKWREQNPEMSYEASLKGWQHSMFSAVKFGRKTSIERKTEEKLKEFGITNFNFSQILNRKYQYDFKIGDDILLEVHGDYWHGNPSKYGELPNLKPLNIQQTNKIMQDKIKKEYAEKNGWKLFVIWEADINKNNWSVIEEIKNAI